MPGAVGRVTLALKEQLCYLPGGEDGARGRGKSQLQEKPVQHNGGAATSLRGRCGCRDRGRAGAGSQCQRNIDAVRILRKSRGDPPTENNWGTETANLVK